MADRSSQRKTRNTWLCASFEYNSSTKGPEISGGCYCDIPIAHGWFQCCGTRAQHDVEEPKHVVMCIPWAYPSTTVAETLCRPVSHSYSCSRKTLSDLPRCASSEGSKKAVNPVKPNFSRDLHRNKKAGRIVLPVVFQSDSQMTSSFHSPNLELYAR